MKKFFTTAIMATLIAMGLYSQDMWKRPIYAVGDYYPGYVILNDGTMREGDIRAQSKYENQYDIYFFVDKRHKEKTVYKPKDAVEYKIADKVYRKVTYKSLFKASDYFMLLTDDGAISSYIHYNTGEGGDGDETIVWSKDGAEGVSYRYVIMKFKQRMSEMVSDYTELATKVANGEKGYGIANFETIIEEYNNWRASQDVSK